MIMTFEQMMEMMDRAVADGQRQMEQSEASRPEGDVDMKYTLSVDPTDEREKINGYQAQRTFMTMQTELTVQQEGEDAQASGNLVVLQDTWNAQDVPMMQALAEMQAKAPEMAARTAGSMGGMGSIFAAKPEMRAAMEEAAKEAGKMEGFPMRSVTYMVLLPSGVEFDREAVLEEKESSGGGIGGLLRGRLGRCGEQPKPEQASSGQTTFVKVTTETEDIKMKSLSADLFEPPAGSTEKPFPMAGS
jgi:hypothetical protein